MKLITVIILLVFVPSSIFAQKCDCGKLFDTLVTKVVNNYSAYPMHDIDKKLKKITQEIRKKSNTVRRQDSCYFFLKQWTNYFKDPHLRIQYNWFYKKNHPEEVAHAIELLNIPIRNSPLRKTSITTINDSTVIIGLPSFDQPYFTQIDSVMKVYTQAYAQNNAILILDIRGYSGGLEQGYAKILSFLYTNKITYESMLIRSTKDNILTMEEAYSNNNDTSDSKIFFESLFHRMKENVGNFVSYNNADTTSFQDSIYPFPKRVGILIDNDCASAAEDFLLIAKQSKKVTTFGAQTRGGIDYQEASFFPLSEAFDLVYAMSMTVRSTHSKYKKGVGIKPDVPLKSSNNNWGNTAFNYLVNPPKVK